VVGSSLELVNAVLADNRSYQGAAVYVNGIGSEAVFDHVTAVGNDAGDDGSFVFFTTSAFVDVHDSVVTENSTTALHEYGPSPTFEQTFSLVSGNTIDYGLSSETVVPSTGVLGNDVTGDPDLAGFTDDGDWTNDDWSLGPVSAAIDAADPEGTPDPDGSAPDMGAFGGALGDWTP
jgi:hypothetical protein